VRFLRGLLLLFLVFTVTAEGRDTAEGWRLRNEVAAALRHIGLSPGDLVVRDIRAWETNAERRRAQGHWAGDWPAPRERDPLRPPLVDRALRHPLEALRIGVALAGGNAVQGMPSRSSRGGFNLVPRLGRLEPLETSEFLWGLLAEFGSLDHEIRVGLGTNTVETRLPEWMIGGLEAGDLARARRVFDRLGTRDVESARRAALRFAASIMRAPPKWPVRWPTEAPVRWKTEDGVIYIGTEGPDVYREDAWIIIDPGGDDLYLNNAGGASGWHRAACVIDLAGNDRYLTDAPFSQGAARFGVGILIDLEGDDTYLGKEFCQGAALVGVGLLLDGGGRDRFVADRFAQGAAAFGHGMLRSLGSDGDTYHVEQYGQGFARTAGYGTLEDHGGDDRYVAGTKYPSSMYSQWTGGRTVHWSFAQGCSFGFYCRYDEPDGAGGRRLVTREMFPGGVGLLIDHDGHDNYEGSMYAQGTAYFYGLGMLIDRAGNDRYRATWYGQGAAPHFAAGILVDAAGDDVYEGMHQVQGNGRDFSVGVFVDLIGDDRYFAEDRVQGCGDLADGYGIFIDAAGNDVYEATRKTATTSTRPRGRPRAASRPSGDPTGSRARTGPTATWACSWTWTVSTSTAAPRAGRTARSGSSGRRDGEWGWTDETVGTGSLSSRAAPGDGGGLSPVD